jgi:hypothetical protein
LNGVVKGWVAIHVWATESGRNLDVLNQLGEEFRATAIDNGFFVLGSCPFGVAGHNAPR